MSKLQQQLFTWCGKDTLGRKLQGQQRAFHAHIVRIDLERQGITPLWVRKTSRLRLKHNNTSIRAGDISVFTRQLATMINAGIPIVPALITLQRSQTHGRLALMISQIQQAVENGSTLAHAFAEQPCLAHPLITGLIDAGEQAGALDMMLERVALHREKSERLQSHIKKALFYPVTIMIIALLITMGLLIFIVPQFTSIFASFGAILPAPTRIVILLSQVVIKYAWLIIMSMGLIIFGIHKAYRHIESVAYVIDRIILKLYIIGPLLQKAAIARLCDTLAITFAAGMPMVDALHIIIQSTGNHVFAKAIITVRDGVLTGQPMYMAMQQHAIFPALVIQMVAVGEESGTLEIMLTKIATYYTEQVDRAVSYLSALMEPIIMVVLGLLIGGIVIAMYLPIFKLGGVIGSV